MSQLIYIEEIVLNTYRLEGAVGAAGVNIGTQSEERLKSVIRSLTKIVGESERVRTK